MFDPDDNKRTGVRRPPHDSVPTQQDTSRRAVSRPSPPRTPAALIERLANSTAVPRHAKPADLNQGERQHAQTTSVAPGAEIRSETRPGGFSTWLKARKNKIKPSPVEKPLPLAPSYSERPAYEIYDERPDQRDRPLIDLVTIVNSVWQLRKVVIVLTVLGTVGGILLAVSTPSVYVSESKLYVDPREVRLTDSDLSKESLATEAILALVDSQLEVLRSRAVLEKVAVDMGLDRDPEFGKASASAGGFAAGVDVIRNIVAPDKGQPASATGIDPRTLEKLSDAVSVSRDPKTFIVTIQVQSRDPAKSALIANRIVTTFLNEEQAAQSGFFQRTTAALDSRLSDLRQQLDTAENAVEKYKAENDISGASGELISDKQLFALNDQVGAVRTRIAEARAKADVATKTQLDDVLSGAFPEELSSVTLQELRKQYSNARAQLSSLDASLGPRHPQRLASAKSLEVARSEIGNELRRIEATAQTELDRAIRTEKDLVQQLAVLKAQQFNSSTGFIELRELERKANATRTIYESFLKRASETGQEEKLTSKNIRVISSAQPSLQAKGPSRKLIAIGGMLAGFMIGIGMGIALGAYRSLKNLLQRSNTASLPVIKRPPPKQDDEALDRSGYEPDPSSAVEPPANLPSPQRATMPRQTPMPQNTRLPSAHHTAASSAALSAFPAASAFHGYPRDTMESDQAVENGQGDNDMAKVQADLRALRSRVESYAKSRTGTGR